MKYQYADINIGSIRNDLKNIDTNITKGRGKKNCEKAARLTAWVDPPPLPRSGQVNVKILDKLPYLGLFAVLYRTKMGQHFHK